MLTGLTLVIMIAVGTGLGELAVRGVALVNGDWSRRLRGSDPAASVIEPHGELGYRQKPRSTYRYINGTKATSNAMGFRGPEVAIPKPPELIRIVLLGGSTTHGWGVNDSETIDTFMRREL